MAPISLGMLAMLGTTEVLLLLAVLAVGSILLAAFVGIALWLLIRERRQASAPTKHPGDGQV